MIHSTFHRGKKIRLILKNGEVRIERYKDKKKGQAIITYESGEIPIKDIQSANYYKPLRHEI